MWQLLHKNNKSPFRIVIVGFLLVILPGSFLLMLPIATKDRIVTLFLDALFTSTSAVCVTGLIIYDTATYWSGFGQLVIILLIQIGGLGVVTVAGAFAILSGRRIGLMQRSTMQEAIAAPNVGGIVRLIGFILKTALAVEMLGAILLFPGFYREFGQIKGVWYALFHSISAFCNAGVRPDGNQSAIFLADRLFGRSRGLDRDRAFDRCGRYRIFDMGGYLDESAALSSLPHAEQSDFVGDGCADFHSDCILFLL